jgi:hypothetical protein
LPNPHPPTARDDPVWLTTAYSHLLEKLQALGQKKMENQTQVLEGEVLPIPIKRRFLS